MWNLRKRLKLSQCVEQYLDHCTALGQSPRTLESKHSSTKLFLNWCNSEGLSYAHKVKPENLEQYRKHLCRYRQPFSKQPLDLATQRNRLTAIKVLFRFLKRHRLITSDPAANFDLPKVPQRMPSGMFSLSEIEAVFDQAEVSEPLGLRDRAILETFYATGIRRMELANLNINDLDVRQHLLTICKGKGGKDRRVPIAARACCCIETYLLQTRPALQQPHY